MLCFPATGRNKNTDQNFILLLSVSLDIKCCTANCLTMLSTSSPFLRPVIIWCASKVTLHWMLVLNFENYLVYCSLYYMILKTVLCECLGSLSTTRLLYGWTNKQTEKQNTTLDKIRLFLNIRSPKIFISPINLSFYGIHVSSLWETTKDGTLCAEGLTKKFPPVMQILDLEIFFSVLFQRDIRNKHTKWTTIMLSRLMFQILACSVVVSLARLSASASYGVNTSLLGTGVKLPFLIGTLNNLW